MAQDRNTADVHQCKWAVLIWNLNEIEFLSRRGGADSVRQNIRTENLEDKVRNKKHGPVYVKCPEFPKPRNKSLLVFALG